MSRVLLYGDVDLNLVDGSAIWLASVAEVLGGAPNVSVTVLQKCPVSRDLVIRRAAALPNVTFVDPWARAADDPEFSAVTSRCGGRRLCPNGAVDLMSLLDRDALFDVIFVRGGEATALVAEKPRLANRLWAYITDPLRYTAPGERSKLRHVAQQSSRIVCQTEEAKSALLELLESTRPEKLIVLPPMIPQLATSTREALNPAAPRLGYSGKFSPPYLLLEMLDAFEKIRARVPGAEFHIVGDKFHNMPPVRNFTEDLTRRLSKTPGVVWHGAVSRDEANQILSRVHVAASWRAPEFDNSLEFSTKVLEYSALGIPVLMNPSPIQRRVFGPEYPAYVSTESEFIERFLTLTSSSELYDRVSQSVQATAAEYTFARNRERLMRVLPNGTSRRAAAARAQTILWAGHDFKFLRPIKEALERDWGYNSLVDEHQGHVIQQPERSRGLLAQADLIFCEWCLGNAEWYSQHKRPGQRLVIRLHHQELQLPYLDRIQWDNVDRLIFICPRNMELFLDRFPSLKSKVVLIYNVVDCTAFNLSKLEGAEFNLGLLGIAPKRKAPHLAFELLTLLKQRDSRYTLHIKSRHPSEYAWLWRQPAERKYYEELFAAIDSSPYANSVIWDTHGDDVPEWFTKIGFILSPSDHEGSHQAVAEGMASGAIPVIRNWAGADQIYPPKYVFSDVASGAEMVFKWNTVQYYPSESAFCRDFARRFDLDVIVRQYSGLLGNLGSPSRQVLLPRASKQAAMS